MKNEPRATAQGKRPEKDVTITITITETVAGKLDMHASVPDYAAGTVAGRLAATLMEGSRQIMNEITGTEARIHEIKGH